MADRRNQIQDAVFAALDDLNQQRGPGEQLAKLPGTRLAGLDGQLDSLGVVNLIVSLEQQLEGLGIPDLNLLDDERLDAGAEQFRTVESLVDYLTRIAAGTQHG